MQSIHLREKSNRDKFYQKLYADGPGLIFLALEDPINQLIIRVFQKPYSAIGFYCPTTVYGSLKILVYIKDYSGKYDKIYKSGIDLEDIITDPTVTKIGIRSLRNKQFDVRFRQILIETLHRKLSNTVKNQSVEIPDLIETPQDDTISHMYCLLKLFGYTSINNVELFSGLDLVRDILDQMGCLGKTDTSPRADPIKSLCYLGSLFLNSLSGFSAVNEALINDNSNLIDLCMTTNSFFKEIIHHDCSWKGPSPELVFKEHRYKLQQMFRLIFQEILGDVRFFKTQIPQIHNISNDNYKAILSEMSDTASRLAEILIKSIVNRKMPLNIINDHLLGLNLCLIRSSKIMYYNFPLADLKQIEKQIAGENFTLEIYTPLRQTQPSNDIDAPELIPQKPIINRISDLHNFVCNILYNASRNNANQIDINYLVDIVNDMAPDLPRIQKLASGQAFEAIIYTDEWNCLDTPIVLSTSKTRISVRNPNLSHLTISQLKELLVVLNDLSRDETLRNLYQVLTNKATERLAELSGH